MPAVIASACRCGGKRVKGRCDKCGSGAGTHTKSARERGYGTDWTRVSRMVRTEEPLCVVCKAQGRTTAATEVHHVKPIKDAPGERLQRDNLMSVCRTCHEELE